MTPSDLSSVDDRHQHTMLLRRHRHLLNPRLWQWPSTPVMTASGTTMTMPATPMKGDATLPSRVGSVKKWGVRRRRGTISTPSEVIGGLFSYYSFLFSIHFLIYHSFHQPNRKHKLPLAVLLVQNPNVGFLLHMKHQCPRRIPQHLVVLPPQQKSNTHIRIGLVFRPSSGTGSPGAPFFRTFRMKRTE